MVTAFNSNSQDEKQFSDNEDVSKRSFAFKALSRSIAPAPDAKIPAAPLPDPALQLKDLRSS